MMITRRHDLPFFGDVMNTLFDDNLFEPIKKMAVKRIPSVNITEKEDGFAIEVAAPGMKKEDFRAEVKQDTLTIWSENKENHEEDKGNYAVREFNYTSFKRSFSLPKSVDKTQIEARYTDGILHITIAKKAADDHNQTKKIEIS